MEIWDAYYRDGSLAGFDLVREKNIPDGYYHLVCEVVVKHIDGDYLMMQRDYQKRSYPGYFDLTAGGSALKGEDALTCIKRELAEETGISDGEFIEIGRIVDDEVHSIYHQFLCITDVKKDAIQVQAGETIAYKWMSKNELKNIVYSDEFIPRLRDRLTRYFEVFNVGESFDCVIDRPIGALHPKRKGLIYPINYGYIPNLFAGDGEEQDVYILGVDEPLKTFTGVIIGILIRLNDNENKWVIAPEGIDFTNEEIISKTVFQERFYKTVLVR